jgi:ubiquitin C-terminal hydrolase
MAPRVERPASIRLRNKQDDEMDDDGYSTIPGQDIKEGKCRDHDGYEMIDSSENSRVFGLSNHGNTCFTSAILQVFS